MFDLALIEDELWAVGGRGQCYRRSGAGWNRIATKSLDALELGQANFGHIVGSNAKQIYLTYTLPPDQAVIPPVEEEKLMKSGSWDEWNEAHERANAMRVRKTSTRGLLFWDGRAFSKITVPLPESETIDALYMGENGLVYLAGGAGAIAVGDNNVGFSLLTNSTSLDRIISICKFGSEIYCLSRSGMVKIEREKVYSVHLPFTDSWPLKLAATQKLLFYFDRQARVACFNGEGWNTIALPPALLERNFRSP